MTLKDWIPPASLIRVIWEFYFFHQPLPTYICSSLAQGSTCLAYHTLLRRTNFLQGKWRKQFLQITFCRATRHAVHVGSSRMYSTSKRDSEIWFACRRERTMDISLMIMCISTTLFSFLLLWVWLRIPFDFYYFIEWSGFDSMKRNEGQQSMSSTLGINETEWLNNMDRRAHGYYKTTAE